MVSVDMLRKILVECDRLVLFTSQFYVFCLVFIFVSYFIPFLCTIPRIHVKKFKILITVITVNIHCNNNNKKGRFYEDFTKTEHFCLLIPNIKKRFKKVILLFSMNNFSVNLHAFLKIFHDFKGKIVLPSTRI